MVSGLPNMTPIFWRSWLVKTTAVLVWLIAPESLRSACDIRRACIPMLASPISPSISARGTRAATESITTTSTAAERTRVSQISRACSPVSGWEMSRFSISTPQLSGIARVEGMFHIDIGCHTAQLLRLGDDVLADGGLSRRFGAVDFGDAAARDTADPQGNIQGKGTGRDGFDCHVLGFAHAHDGAFAVAFDNITQRFIQDGPAGIIHGGRSGRDLLRGLWGFTRHVSISPKLVLR